MVENHRVTMGDLLKKPTSFKDEEPSIEELRKRRPREEPPSEKGKSGLDLLKEDSGFTKGSHIK